MQAEATTSGLGAGCSSAEMTGGGGEQTPGRAHSVPGTLGAPGQNLI